MLYSKFKKLFPNWFKSNAKLFIQTQILIVLLVWYKFKRFKKKRSRKKSILIFTYLDNFGGVEKAVLGLMRNLKQMNSYKLTLLYSSQVERPYMLRDFESLGIYCVGIGDTEFGFIKAIKQGNIICNLVMRRGIEVAIITNAPFYIPVWKVIKVLDRKIRIICWVHGAYENFYNIKKIALHNKLFSKIVVFNNYFMNLFQNEFTSKIAIIANGVDTSYFNPYNPFLKNARKKLMIPHDAFVCTYIGRLAPEKNPFLILEIARKLKKHNVLFLMVGDGILEKHIKKKVQKNKLGSYFRFYGYQENIPLFLATSNVLLNTSPVEGMPMSVLESMAMNVPPISSNFSGVDEIFEDQKQGLVVNLKEGGENYSKAILRLIRDKKFYSRMRTKSRKLIFKNFTLGQMTKKFIQIIK